MKSFTFIETDDGVNFKRIIIIITDIMDIRIYEVLTVLSGMTEEDRTTSIKRYSNVPIFFDHLSGRSNEVFASIPSLTATVSHVFPSETSFNGRSLISLNRIVLQSHFELFPFRWRLLQIVQSICCALHNLLSSWIIPQSYNFPYGLTGNSMHSRRPCTRCNTVRYLYDNLNVILRRLFLFFSNFA